MGKKTSGLPPGRPHTFPDYRVFDEWLAANDASGIGVKKWAEQNAARFNMEPETLLQQLHRQRRELNKLC